MQIVRRDVCRKGARARPIFCRKHSNPKMAHTNNSADGGPDPRGAAQAPLSARGRGARLRRTPDAGRRGPPRGHRTPRSGHRPREVARRRSRRSCLPWRSRSPSVRVATWGPDPWCALLLGGGTGDAGGASRCPGSLSKTLFARAQSLLVTATSRGRSAAASHVASFWRLVRSLTILFDQRLKASVI